MNRSMIFWLLLLPTAGASGCREVCSRDEVRQGDRCVPRPDSGMLTDAAEPGMQEDGEHEPEMDASAADPPEEGDSAAPDDEKEGGTQLLEPGECDTSQHLTVYADNDADGHGDIARPHQVCETTAGYVDNADDCDDGDGNIHPGARELCNGKDDDCNASTSDGISDCSGLLCEAGSCRTSCSSSAHCLPGLECAGTSCIGKLAVGAGCGQDGHCTTGSCSPSGTCAEPVALLGDCNSAPDCQTGLTCSTSRCRAGAGQACEGPNACASGHCECGNASCSARACAANDCPSCRFDANGDGTCEGVIQSGRDDDENSCGALACNGAGACTGMAGAACTNPDDCGSGVCGCNEAGCPRRVCLPGPCGTCTYWNGSSCAHLSAGVEHPGACDGPMACRGGSCSAGKHNGEVCFSDAECVATMCAPRATGGNVCGQTGLCDSKADCNPPFCQASDCAECKTTTRECKRAYGPIGCTDDNQCVNYCEVDEGECY